MFFSNDCFVHWEQDICFFTASWSENGVNTNCQTNFWKYYGVPTEAHKMHFEQTPLCQHTQSFEAAEKANSTALMLQLRNLIYQFAGRQDGRKQANLPRVQRTANPSLAPPASWEVITPKKECHAVLRCGRIKTRETASLQVIMRELETSFN